MSNLTTTQQADLKTWLDDKDQSHKQQSKKCKKCGTLACQWNGLWKSTA